MPGGWMHDALVDVAGRRSDHIGVRAGASSWTWGDLDRMTTGFAGLLFEHGVRSGDRVAVMTSNRPEFLVSVEAVSRLGAASVLVSPAWKAAEVEAAAGLTDPALAITDGPATAIWHHLLGSDRVVDLDDRDVADASPGSHGGALGDDRPASAGDEAVLVFSSGTTGLPKAVRHTNSSIAAATEHWVAALGLGPDDRMQVATPPSHILGLLNLLAVVHAGATVRMHERFDLDTVLASIESDKVTLEMAVAPIALAMAAHPELERYDLSSLRYIMWGATPVTPSVAEAVTVRTGVRWLPAYGASELPVIAANPVHEPERWRLDSAGLAPAGVELRIVDLDSGEVLAPGETGEVQARSPSVMAGYLPESETASAFVDGWYRTGDVGWLEADGWVHLTDRCKEMIKVNGFQVAPAEVEGVLHGQPSVRDCAVFGIPDERTGEATVAAVHLEPGSTTSADDLRGVVADSLATYKQVGHVVFVEEIPRLPSGKVLRRMLRDEWEPRLAEGPAPSAHTATTSDRDTGAPTP